jgi:hypothetical protein
MADPLPKTILVRAWLVFSTISTVISIASLFDDIVAWVDFIRQIILAYRGLVDPLWGWLLGALPFHLPRWVHDYLTITSLMSVSILWSLQATSNTFGWRGLGSLLGVIKNNLLDFQIGGNLLELFEKGARRAVGESVGSVPPEVSSVIAHVARPLRQPSLAIIQPVGAALVLVAGILLPIVVPALLRHFDYQSERRTLRLLAARKVELQSTPLPPEILNILMRELENTQGTAEGSLRITELYHDEIRRQIIYYYAAVFAMFVVLVLINYGIQRFQNNNARIA